jgi:multidrug efflux pump subunit AcrB
LGFFILVGLVVNHAMRIAHQSLKFIRKGNMDLNKAIREGIRIRIRLIDMSTATGVFDRVPLVFLPGVVPVFFFCYLGLCLKKQVITGAHQY